MSGPHVGGPSSASPDRSPARVAVVTGATRGIGRATALALARRGHHVVVLWRHDEEGAAKTVAEAEAESADGAMVVSVQADVGAPAQVDAAFAEIERSVGPVSVLVNNAGITRDALLLRMGDDEWRDVLRTSLDGAFFCTRRATRHMVRARWGRVVNVGSVVATVGSAGQANYAAAKAGLLGFTRSVARELGSRGITANLVAPGPIATAMTDALPEERRAALAAQAPVGRLGTADEVAAAICFLCSDEAAYVNGAVLPVDGGLGMGH
ncbi:MAG: beta-ketoacyl-ACP reductase [Acidimicrobiales bacterium]